MIRYLRMDNFRRHERTQIELGDDDRTIVVAGQNGAGKSSVIEAITYALVGEGRNGNRYLDRLVRRGAELEGMEVEMAFDIDGATYRVIRRRDGRSASAVLTVNDQPLVEGSRHVTAAIEDILGMDSQGIRLAVIAQQKELNGLGQLGSPQRAKAVGRLLHLDALSRARDDARQQYRVAEGALQAIPNAGDLGENAAAVARAEAEHARCQAAEASCRAAVANLEAELALSGGIDAAYQAAREELASAKATVAAVRSELARLEAEQRSIIVPAELLAGESLIVLERRAAELEHTIAHAEAAKRVAEQRRIVGSELDRAVARRASLVGTLDDGDAAHWQNVADHQRQLATDARRRALEASNRRETLREELGRVRAEVEVWKRRQATLAELGAVCGTCGQEVGAEHLEHENSAAETKIQAGKTREAEITSQGIAARDEWQACEDESRKADEAAALADKRAQLAAGAEGEIVELDRRIASYQGQLDRLVENDSDVDALYAKKGEITLAVMNARAAEERRRERQSAMERIAELELTLADARRRLEDAETVEAKASLDAELERAWAERQRLLEAHRAELEMLTALAAQTAEARAEEASKKAALRAANELAGARRAQQEKGVAAANAQRLLADVEQTLGGQIRPMLEGSVSEILAKMSGGRFSSVRVGADYELTVLDDGKYRPLSELSGGESDLCALALRLGLADVVCSRNGGVGFLILDEVFGSQDGERRESILTALRALRGTYGQIWCISHVGGLDEAADKVITVEQDENGVSHAT